jgi:hypothetical protein
MYATVEGIEYSPGPGVVVILFFNLSSFPNTCEGVVGLDFLANSYSPGPGDNSRF